MNDSGFDWGFDKRTSFHFSSTVKWSESSLLHTSFSNFCKRIDSMITPTLYKDFEPEKIQMTGNSPPSQWSNIEYVKSTSLVQNPKLNINRHQIDSRFGSGWLKKEMNGIINPFWSRINTRDHHTTTEHTGRWLTGQHLRIEPICSRYQIIFENVIWW